MVTRRVRLQAISLAIVLAIIGQTQGFTLRYEYVRPHDLTAEESSVTEVKHELKRDVDENEEYHVEPIGFAMPLIMTTEATATSDNEAGTIQNETLSDRLETTVIPNKNAESTEDMMGSSSNNNEVKAFLFQELERVDNTTSTSRTQEGSTTVMTTFGVTDNRVETSATEATNTSKDIENTISEKIYSTIPPPPPSATNDSTNTKPPYSGGTQTELPNTVDITTESSNVSVETTPAWKKYTKIERKPVNISEEAVLPLRTERIGDSVNAHTTETRVSLEKAFGLAPDILSLQELKNHLMDTTNSIPTTDFLKVADATKGNLKSVDNTTKEESKPTEVNPTEIVSMRAGYLDHTKPLIETEVGGVAYEMDAHEDDDTGNMTSHSQMVEDAMKEEFLKEARVVDSLHYTTSINDKLNADINEIRPLDQIAYQQAPEDLTVRPINYEKKNNLYTVSPNYKPLKKIEVQPSKPFMRDPDDNSWRNESLSSLGIVFKGTNSSKAFTEVLKNKTETVMSNLPEPERALEKVELRDRLEKIAEKRKRKKKIDKFGNTEYGDYEENSSGDAHSSKEKLSSVSELSLTTSTLPTVIKENIWRGSVKASSKNKSKSALNDYYDGKEDYADYATFPNIDILKSTQRPRVQWPVTQKMLDSTQPIKPYLPDRQPTVQYFPPRPKALTPNDSNNYRDKYLKQKFTFFGHTAQPQNEPIETYEYNERTEKNPGTYRTEKFVPDDRTRAPTENKNPPIQHVEYRPVGVTDGSFSIRHYKDLLESVIKDTDYDRNGPYQQTPVIADEGKSVKSEEYDYGQRKEGLNRFVDYFNQNHERFKADFPVLFNTSVVHGSESGKVLASSSAVFKRLYNDAQTGQKETFAFSDKPFDINCDNITVELSPAYELHYYVPEQEETGDHTLPNSYRT